jgi:hypothetical protein
MKDQMVAVDQAANIGIQFQGERPSGPAFIIWSIPTKRTLGTAIERATAILVYMLSPLPRRSGWAYYFAHSPQPYQPSPKGLSGRPAHCPFRGLLGVHSRYGLHTRAVTNS